MKKKNKKQKISIVKMLWSVMTTKNKAEFFALLALGVISSIAILIPTQIVSLIINKLSGLPVAILGFTIPNSIGWVEIIVFGGIITYFMRFLSFTYGLNMEKLIKKVVANLREENYDWLIVPRKNMDLKMTQGDALYRLNQGPETITMVIEHFFTSVLPEILSGLIALVYILFIDIQTMPVLFVGMFLIVVCVVLRAITEKKISFRTEKAKSAISTNVANSITNLSVINLYKSMAFESMLFSKRVKAYYTEQKKQINLRWIYWSMVRLIEVLSTFVIIYLCASRIYAKTMDVGNVIVIVNYVARIFAPIQTIGYFATNWLQCTVAVERLYELKPKKQDLLPLDSIDIDKIETIKLSDVGAKHGSSFEIDGINMTFKTGEMTVVSGESGTGKTTIIKLICGLVERTKGDIFVNGNKIDSSYKLVDKMSVSMQDAYIFNRDAKKNIFYPTGEASENSAGVIEMLSMQRLVRRGYDDNSEQNFENKLSGGEKKRIGISRAMLKPADVYIFDEPTNDLDNKNANNVIKNIKTLAKDAIVIVVSHDDRLKNQADKMITLKKVQTENETEKTTLETFTDVPLKVNQDNL